MAITTKRLTELEAELTDFSTGGWHATTAQLKIEGYRMALAEVKPVLEAASKAQALVNMQAEDEGLWFVAQTAPEAYLQQELRKLHAAIEAQNAE